MTATANGDIGVAPVLEATDLVVEYVTTRGIVRSLDAATLTIQPGQIVGLVGESGSGKTTLGMAAGRLLASNAAHVSGSLSVAGQTVFGAEAPVEQDLRDLRRDVLGYVFQNPVSALDPTMRIQRQLELASIGSRGRRDVDAISEALTDVGLRNVPRVLRSFPHELSGGMAQRVGIALALRRRPQLLVADEPTAAVDATLRAQILQLLVEKCRDRNCALLLLTHDLHAVAEHTERIAVMYGGRVVEQGPTQDVLARPLHPYTQALLAALPGGEAHGQRLRAIRGVPPTLVTACPGCAFAARCPDVLPHCQDTRPVHGTVATPDAGHRELACHLYPTESSSRSERAVASHVSEGSDDHGRSR